MKPVIMQKAGRYLADGRKRRRFFTLLGALSAGTVFGVYTMLTLPAVSMEGRELAVEAPVAVVPFGEAIETHVTANAAPNLEQTTFLLAPDREDVRLADSYVLENGTAQVETDSGELLKLYRAPGEDGLNAYWFTLDQGSAVSFSLNYIAEAPLTAEKGDEVGNASSDAGDPKDTITGSGVESDTTSNTVSSDHADTGEASSNSSAPEVTTTDASSVELLPLPVPPADTDTQEAKLYYVWAETPEEALALPESSDCDALAMVWTSNEELLAAAVPPAGSMALEPYITGARVEKNNGGQWQAVTKVVDGDEIRVTIQYAMQAELVTPQRKVFTYQLDRAVTPMGELSGTVFSMTDGQEIGKYTISTSGLITIVFSDAFAAEQGAVSGYVTFRGKASLSGGEESHEVTFGASGSTVTISSATDLGLQKSATLSTDKKVISYTLTVTTQNGTGGSKVDISDQFRSKDLAAYNQGSFHVVRKSTGGGTTEIPASSYTLSFQSKTFPGFTLTGLPALKAGETYIVSYTAVPSAAAGGSGASSVGNTATAVSGQHSATASASVQLTKQMVRKDGYYDRTTGKITWVITINEDKRDISGFVLSDILNGKAYSGAVVLKNTDTNSEQKVNLPYIFPSGSTGKFTATYVTDAPAAAGTTVNNVNTATLTKGSENYTGSATVTVTHLNGGLTKSFSGESSPGKNGAVYNWTAALTLPDGGVTAGSDFTYTDTVLPSTDKAEDHWTTPALLAAMTVRLDGKAITIKTIACYDASGRVIKYDKADTASHVARFVVTFQTPMKGNSLTLDYATYADYTGMNDDEIRTFRNRGEALGIVSEAQHSHSKGVPLEKRAAAAGWGDTAAYPQAGNLIQDISSFGGKILYRVLLRTDSDTKGDIVLKDTLPQGAVPAGGQSASFFVNDSWQENAITWWDSSIKPYGAQVTYNLAGNQAPSWEYDSAANTLTVTIRDGYNGDGNAHAIVLYYSISVKDDSFWADMTQESKNYANKVEWNGKTASQTTTVERKVPRLNKTGRQLADAEGKLIDKVEYNLVVNPAGLDLAEGADTLKLTDVLTVDSKAFADLLPETVKLYRYDAKAEYHRGTEISRASWSFLYDELSHTLTFTLPDALPCVLAYQYHFDRGDLSGDIGLSNQATLAGSTSSGSSSQMQLKEASSAAGAVRKQLIVYKVDSADYSKRLAGAQFALRRYASSKWEEMGSYVTGNDGRIVFDLFDGTGSKFATNQLYSLAETTPPSGYAASPKIYYFVWMEQGASKDSTIQAMTAKQAIGGISTADIRFLPYGGGAIYVPNVYTALTVQKYWSNEAGQTVPPPVESVDVTLYSQAYRTKACTVTVLVKSTGVNGATYQNQIRVAPGSPLTVRVASWAGADYTTAIDSGVSGSGALATVDWNTVYQYDIPRVSADCTLTLSREYATIDSGSKILFSGYTNPTANEAAGTPTLVETVTLSGERDWAFTWPGLPPNDSQGNAIVYWVEEKDGERWKVAYFHDRIQSGTINVVNTVPTIVQLPDTGGGGIESLEISGIALAGASAGVLIWKKRKRRGGL